MVTKAELLLSAPQSVFTVDDLAVLWQVPDRKRLWESIKYHLRTDRLKLVHRGVYATSKDYSPFEAAIKLFPPAYVSFISALAFHGAYYQYTSEIHLMAQASKRLNDDNGNVYVYHQLKNAILLNQQGVEYIDGYWMATLERAICDTSYLDPGYVFEHTEKVDSVKLQEIVKIYGNNALKLRIEDIIHSIHRNG